MTETERLAGARRPAYVTPVTVTGDTHNSQGAAKFMARGAGASREKFEEQVAALGCAVEKAIQALETVRARTRVIDQGLESGLSVGELVADEEQPLAVEVLREAVADMSEALGRFQRSEARALYDEGLTMEQIATLFGISRPRVSKLLRETGVPSGGGRRRGRQQEKG